jgi:CheY-like chemotaxis protein
LESIIFNVENINLGTIEFSYSFRQHEWASLLGKSGRQKLLIIEDDEAVRRTMLKYLDSVQIYDLFNAKDGLEGVFKALLVDPQLILTDISMPKLDGLAMCQIFYILNKPCPIAFVTSLDNDEILQKAKKAQGSVGLLDKSILQHKEQFLEQVAFLTKQAGALKSQ